MKTFEDVYAVLQALAKCHIYDDTHWYARDNEITVGLMCSDVFFWGVADAEDVEAEDIPLLTQTYNDLKALDIALCIYTPTLYAARKRKMRPQGAMYKHLPQKLWPLFHACGPVREVGFGNPHEVPDAV